MTVPNKIAYRFAKIVPSFVLVSGSCNQIKRISEALLFGINILGGLCLAVSSFLQQLCTSPTHEDIVVTMAKSGDIDFGAISLSTLFHRKHTRKMVCALWFVLLLTSLPAHLFLNASIGLSPTLLLPTAAALYPNMTSKYITGNQLSWTNLTGQECTSIVTSVEVVPNLNVSNITAVLDPVTTSKCNFLFSNPDDALPIAPPWNENITGDLSSFLNFCGSDPVLYCLVDVVTEQCGVTVRWLPFIIFSSALSFKALIACLAVSFLPHFKKRLYNNLGDIIYFAVENPDITVPNESLCSRCKQPNLRTLGGIETTANRKSKFWISFLGTGDILSYVFLIIGVIAAWTLGIWNITGPTHPNFSWEQPEFGLLNNTYGTDPGPGFTWWLTPESSSEAPILETILVANIAQLPISIAYILFNNQITRLWREYEWRSFYLKKKKPRTAIASNCPGTRPTRWLQLPYSLSALMIAVSICLHWVASQAFYLVESYDASFQQLTLIVYQIPLPTIVLAIIWTTLTVVLTFIYIRPQRSVMPFMCGSARVVFASCCSLTQLPSEGIMWGDITGSSDSSKRKAGFGAEASAIVEGELYS